MEVYGYIKGSALDEPSKMSEVSFACSIEEIGTLINFLKQVQVDHEKMKDMPGIYHTHFKDWKREEVKTDFIIVTQI